MLTIYHAATPAGNEAASLFFLNMELARFDGQLGSVYFGHEAVEYSFRSQPHGTIKLGRYYWRKC